MLLDPCAAAPADHLRIEPTGELVGRDEHGATTVKLLQLNRPELAQDRRRELLKLGLDTPDVGHADWQRRFAEVFDRNLRYPGILLIRLIQALPEKHPFRAWGREPLTLSRALRLVEEGVPDPGHDVRAPSRPIEVRTSERRYIRRIIVEQFRE